MQLGVGAPASPGRVWPNDCLADVCVGSRHRIHCLYSANGQPFLTSIREAGVAHHLTRLEQVSRKRERDFDIAPRVSSPQLFQIRSAKATRTGDPRKSWTTRSW
jgi:hypothetical protein